jgi:MoaA/NifB/PqqE/SkfB family radical SAM enzyme
MLRKYLAWVDNIIVSLDGNEEVHDRIRNIPNAYQKLKEGVQLIKGREPKFRISARTVIHKIEFQGLEFNY